MSGHLENALSGMFREFDMRYGVKIVCLLLGTLTFGCASPSSTETAQERTERFARCMEIRKEEAMKRKYETGSAAQRLGGTMWNVFEAGVIENCGDFEEIWENMNEEEQRIFLEKNQAIMERYN